MPESSTVPAGHRCREMRMRPTEIAPRSADSIRNSKVSGSGVHRRFRPPRDEIASNPLLPRSSTLVYIRQLPSCSTDRIRIPEFLPNTGCCGRAGCSRNIHNETSKYPDEPIGRIHAVRRNCRRMERICHLDFGECKEGIRAPRHGIRLRVGTSCAHVSAVFLHRQRRPPSRSRILQDRNSTASPQTGAVLSHFASGWRASNHRFRRYRRPGNAHIQARCTHARRFHRRHPLSCAHLRPRCRVPHERPTRLPPQPAPILVVDPNNASRIGTRNAQFGKFDNVWPNIPAGVTVRCMTGIEETRRLLFRNVRIFDGISDHLSNGDVLIEGNRITAVSENPIGEAPRAPAKSHSCMSGGMK